MSMRLSDCAQNRDNNFNLIRVIAAISVMVDHCCALTRQPEPGSEYLKFTIGSAAVNVFFVASGFLVTGSLLRIRSTGEFLWARTLRLLPGLWVMVLLCVGVLGPIFTRWPVHRYFAAPATLTYLVKNMTLVTGIRYNLPGVFVGLPARGAVNGSLWTLPHEAYAYALLAAVWFLLVRKSEGTPRRFKVASVALFVLLATAVFTTPFLFSDSQQLLRHGYMFFAGTLFYLFRDRVVLSARVFWLLVVLLLLSTEDYDCFFLIYPITSPYLLLYLAYVPGGFIRRYNQLGDYSYGIYIYAFPIQQVVLALHPHITAGGMALFALPTTLLFAIFSWRLVEKPALSLKRRCGDHCSQLLAYGWRLVSSATHKGQAPT